MATAKKENNSQYIIRVSAENIKNVRVIDFIPNRYVTMISGGNGAGKTSALDVVFYALAGRKTLSPTLIRQGQKKGFIRVETTTHIVTRHLDDKGGRLQIEAKASNTLEKSPDDWLNGIAGGLGLDPLKFMRMDADEQMENIRPLVKLDVDIDDLETRNEADSETLKARKAEAKRLEAARDHVTVDKTLPAESADIPELLQQSRAAAEHNEAIKAEKRRRDSIEDQSIRFNQQYEAKQKEIANLQSELALLKNSIDATLKTRKEWKPLAELQDLAPLDAKVSEATRTNSAIATNNANKATRDRFERDVDTIKTQVEKLEEDVRTRRIRIATALEKAKFPIEGLGFETTAEGSGGRELKKPKRILTYKGVPLAQASSAEQIKVSTAIGMAGDPELKFLLIRDGSLLDDEGLAILEQMAHENSYQILMERVDTSGKVGIFMEDGTIKAVNAESTAKTPAPKTTGKKTKNEKQGELIK